MIELLNNRDLDRKASMNFSFPNFYANHTNNLATTTVVGNTANNNNFMMQSPALNPSHHNIMSSPMISM